MRRLIINADDFGYTAGVNRAVGECAHAGVVTSATLMANGAAFADAVSSLAQGTISVGCHTVVVDGQPVSAATEISSLCRDGRFRGSITDLMRAALTGEIDQDDVGREATAQFRTLRSAGVDPSHFDTHKHAHIFPAIYRPMLQAAKEAGIAAVRNPFEPASMQWMATPGLWLRGFQTAGLRVFQPGFRRAVKDAKLKTPDGTVGIALTGMVDSNWLRRIVQGISEGTWELVCHPGHLDSALEQAGTRLLRSREIERQALLAEGFKDVLAREKIELINYWEL